MEEKLYVTKEKAKECIKYAETQLFLFVLLMMKLIDDGDLKNAKEFGDFAFAMLKKVNLRTIDSLSAKLMYLIALAYEKQGMLSDVRVMMFEAYKASCLRHD